MSDKGFPNIQNPDQDIIEQFKDEIEEIRKTENIDVGKCFDLWILMNYFDIEKEIAITKLIDDPNDKRVDAFIEEDNTINIVQCKYFDNPSKNVKSNEVTLFKGCIDWLKNPDEVKKLNRDLLYDAAQTFSERWDEGIDIELHYFAFGNFSNEAQHERIVFNNSDSKDRIQMYFHDLNDILTLFRTKSKSESTLANEKINIELIPNEYFIKKGKMPSIVATIKGSDLLKMYEKYRDNLFERNIRLYKGARKGSINAKIIDTILSEKERKNFWYYNNGISFVCKDFKIKDQISEKDDVKHKFLEVKGFQVINGCQTTVCMHEAKTRTQEWHDLPKNIQVIVRFIKAPIKKVDLITLYTNSQNPVSELQLKSNDTIQKRLKEDMSKYSPPYYYSIKEGDWQRVLPKEKKKYKDRILTMSEIAQSVYSFNADPAFARRWKNRLFSEKYYEIFRKDISVEELILPWKILKVINKNISEYRRNEFNRVKKDISAFTNDEKEDIKKREFLIYSNLIILNFIGKLIRKRYNQYSQLIAKKLLNRRLEERIAKIFNYIVGTLKYSDKITKETNLIRFLKNIDSINKLYEDVLRSVETDTARTGNNPLREMLPEIDGI